MNIVTYQRAVEFAKLLKSVDGENPEYDRALVELISDMFGFDYEFRRLVAHDIGIGEWKERTMGEEARELDLYDQLEALGVVLEVRSDGSIYIPAQEIIIEGESSE